MFFSMGTYTQPTYIIFSHKRFQGCFVNKTRGQKKSHPINNVSPFSGVPTFMYSVLFSNYIPLSHISRRKSVELSSFLLLFFSLLYYPPPAHLFSSLHVVVAIVCNNESIVQFNSFAQHLCPRRGELCLQMDGERKKAIRQPRVLIKIIRKG